MSAPALGDFVYTPAEVQAMLKISRSTVYELLRTGDLPSAKVGHSIRITRKDLEAYLNRSALEVKE